MVEQLCSLLNWPLIESRSTPDEIITQITPNGTSLGATQDELGAPRSHPACHLAPSFTWVIAWPLVAGGSSELGCDQSAVLPTFHEESEVSGKLRGLNFPNSTRHDLSALHLLEGFCRGMRASPEQQKVMEVSVI